MTPRALRRKYPAIALICILVMLPLVARADVASIIQLLTTITNTLKGDIGRALSGVQQVNNERRGLQQQLVWPIAAINQARASAQQVRSRFSSLAGQIHSTPVSSATLTNAQQLELILRANRSANIGGIQPAYFRIYGAVPAATDATVSDRNLMDIDDAMAAGSLKTATISGQASEQMLSVADVLEQQAAQTSPGGAPLLTAQAQVANLENQAFLQKMLAAELRQEGTRLAHDNALRKRGAAANRTLRNSMQQILSRP
jgi:hypothetical protein